MNERKSFLKTLIACFCAFLFCIVAVGCSNKNETPQETQKQESTSDVPVETPAETEDVAEYVNIAVADVLKTLKRSEDEKLTQTTTYSYEELGEMPTNKVKMEQVATFNIILGEYYTQISYKDGYGEMGTPEDEDSMYDNIYDYERYYIEGKSFYGIEDIDLSKLAELYAGNTQELEGMPAEGYYDFTYDNLNGFENLSSSHVIASISNLKEEYNACNEMYLNTDLLNILRVAESEVQMEYLIKGALIESGGEVKTYHYSENLYPLPQNEEFFSIDYSARTDVNLSARKYKDGTTSILIEITSEDDTQTMSVVESVEYFVRDGLIVEYNYQADTYAPDATHIKTATYNTKYEYGKFVAEMRPTMEKLEQLVAVLNEMNERHHPQEA